MSTVTRKGSASDDWDEFRNLCLLVTLVTAINDPNSRSTLNSGKLDRNGLVDSNTQTVMHAITAILVLEHEILACMVEKPSDGSVSSGSLLVIQDDRTAIYEVDRDDEYGGSYRVDTGKLQVTAIANPDRDGDKILSRCNQCCIQMAPGTDRWPQILESGQWSFLHTEVSLLDHIATVSGYLNHYRLSTPEERTKCTLKFHDYITSVCWRKNHRRINHWATIALLAQLNKVAQFDLNDMASNMGLMDAKSDVLLARRLTNLAGGEFLTFMVQLHQTKKPPPEFPNLLQRCKQESHVLYTKDTVAEFHDLLVATLVAYAATLQNMFMLTKEQEVAEKKYRAEEKSRAEEKRRAEKERRREEKRAEKERRKEKERAEQQREEVRPREEERLREELHEEASSVSMISRLLGAIMNSRAFESHLEFLNKADLLQLPNAGDEEYYSKFAKDNFIRSVPLPRYRRKAMKRGEDIGTMRSDSGRGGIGGAEDSGEGNDSGEDEDSGERDDSGERNDSGEDQDLGEECDDLEEGNDLDDQDEEQQALRDGVETEGLTSVLCGWMKTLISHYAAKRILEHHCARRLTQSDPGSAVQINFIAVRGRRRLVASWEAMKATIMSAVGSRFLASLEKEILATGTDGPAIFSTFRSLLQGDKVSGHFVVHCETLLAAFAKFGPGFITHLSDAEKESLERLSERLNQKQVAVSKPCCPACWDFMSVLQTNDASGAFNVRSRHSTVYPVELPAWLPKEIMDGNSRNRGPIPDYRKHRHTYSIENDSGLSITSVASGGSDLQAGDGKEGNLLKGTNMRAHRRDTSDSAPKVTPAAV